MGVATMLELGEDGVKWVANIAEKLNNPIKTTMITHISPEDVSEISKVAGASVGKYKSTLAQRNDAFAHVSDGRKAMWEAVSKPLHMEFLKKVETGAQMKGVAGDMASIYRKGLEAAYKEEGKYGSKSEYVLNYFPHIWDNEDKARQFFAELKQSRGETWFMKARTHELIEQGEAAGMKLKTTNPEELYAHRMTASHEMVEKTRLIRELQSMKMAAPIAGMEKKPFAGFEISAPNGSRWLLHQDLRPLWTNAIESRSMWQSPGVGGSIFRSWMELKNTYVPMKLGVSLFHPIHIAVIDASQNIKTAIEHAIKTGDWGTGLSQAAHALVPRIGFKSGAGFQVGTKEGRDVLENWLKPEAEWSDSARAAIHLIEEGGGSPRMSEELLLNARVSFRKALATGNHAMAAYHGSRRFLEMMQETIFERWIPSLKVSSYLREVKNLFEREPELIDNMAARQVKLREIWKSIDNRYGEMFYGNVFWKPYLKNWGTATFLSLGWQLGFVREIGGALVVDTPKYLYRALTGKGAWSDITSKMLFSYIYLGMGMMLHGAMTAMMTGKAPNEMLDFIYPRTGDTNPDGSEHRLSTSHYIREIGSIYKHISTEGVVEGTWDDVQSKLVVGPVIELMRNRDHFGYDIYDENSPLHVKVGNVLKYVGQQYNPITLEQIQQVRRSGQPAKYEALSLIGFGPASKTIDQTTAQSEISRTFERRFGGISKSLDQKTIDDIKHNLKAAMATGNGDLIQPAIKSAVKAGLNLKHMHSVGLPSDIVQFSMLQKYDQTHLLARFDAKAIGRYAWFAHKDVKAQFAEISPECAGFVKDVQAGKVHPPAIGVGYGKKVQKEGSR